MIAPRDAEELLGFARARIAEEVGGPAAHKPKGAFAEEVGASFVTLRWPDGSLQGCIGSITPRRSLADDVEMNALASAFEDRRGQPLTLSDVDRLGVELSVLSPLERVETDGTEASAAAALRPGVDGVVLSWRGRRATYLPQMWREYLDGGELLKDLKLKARLPRDFWAPDVEVLRYTVEKFEHHPSEAPS